MRDAGLCVFFLFLSLTRVQWANCSLYIPHCTLCALRSKKWENIIMRPTALKQGGKEKFTAGGTGRNFNTSVLITYDSMWRWVMVYILVSMEGETCRRRRKRENGEKGRQNFMIDIIVCFTLCYVGEGNGTPLQYSCLENPIDGGAW